jgi:hypothetical protein
MDAGWRIEHNPPAHEAQPPRFSDSTSWPGFSRPQARAGMGAGAHRGATVPVIVRRPAADGTTKFDDRRRPHRPALVGSPAQFTRHAPDCPGNAPVEKRIGRTTCCALARIDHAAERKRSHSKPFPRSADRRCGAAKPFPIWIPLQPWMQNEPTRPLRAGAHARSGMLSGPATAFAAFRSSPTPVPSHHGTPPRRP